MGGWDGVGERCGGVGGGAGRCGGRRNSLVDFLVS